MVYDLGAITENELNDIERIYMLRNDIGHELFHIIADDNKRPIKLADVMITFSVYLKIMRWWVKEVEATTDPDKTGAGNPNFESVILPFLGSFQPDYDIQVFSDGTWVDDGFSYPLQEFLFSQLGGVSDFRVLGISDSADLLLPSDFVSALTFEDTGVFTGTITELTPAENVPEPSSLVELASGLFFLLAYRGHRRMAQRCAASRRAEPRQTLLT